MAPAQPAVRLRKRQWEAVVKSFEILRSGSALGTIGGYLKSDALASLAAVALWIVLTLVIVGLEAKVEESHDRTAPDRGEP